MYCNVLHEEKFKNGKKVLKNGQNRLRILRVKPFCVWTLFRFAGKGACCFSAVAVLLDCLL